MTQRDWQKDMGIADQLKLWKVDPGGEEDGAAFYTIDTDEIHTTDRADNMLGTDADLLYEGLQALPYWLQEAKELQEIASGRGRECLRLQGLLKGLNDELTATEARADVAKSREVQLKEAIKKAQERFKHGDVIMALIEGSMILTDALDSLYPDTPAPKETESHAPICPRCKLPMKKGTHHEFECVDGCGEWCFEESEEGNNQ